MEEGWMAIVGQLSAPLAALIGIMGVAVGHWLNRGHTRKEKLKDLRREAYGVILAEMAAAQPIYDAACEAISEDSHWYHGSELRERHLDGISKHMRAARQRFTDDYLVLSADFITRFEKMQSDRSTKADDTDPFSNVEPHGELLRLARPELLNIARREVSY